MAVPPPFPSGEPLDSRTKTTTRARFDLKCFFACNGNSWVAGAGRLRECKNTEFVWKLRKTASRAARECPLEIKSFHCILKIDIPGGFIVVFFTRKVSTVIFYWRRLSPLLSAKWFLSLVSVATRFSLTPLVEWRRLSSFPAKMMLVYARAPFSIEKISYSYLSSSQDLNGLWPLGLWGFGVADYD